MSAIIKVLLVDDEPQFLELTKFFLERDGRFAGDTATSTAEALRKMAETRYDAVIADFQMPGSDGIAFLKTLRSQGNDIPFILFTGKGREDVAISALNCGADFYLQKGGDPKSQFAELANMITQSVEGKHAEEQLRESERRFREFLSNAHHAAVILDREGRIEFINEYMLGLTGWAGQDLVGRDWFDMFIPGNLRDNLRSMYAETIRDEKLAFKRPHKNEVMARDGTLRTVLWDNTMLRDYSGRVTGVASLGEDITERKAEEEILRLLVENAHDIIFRYRFAPTQGFEYVSPAATHITGYAPEEYYADPELGMRLVHPDDAKLLRSVIEEPGKARRPLVLRWIRKDGRTVWTEQRLTPVRDDSGNVVAIDGIARDVTEQVNAREELRMSEERYRAFVRNLHGIAFLTDTRFVPLFYHGAIEEITGYKEEDLVSGRVGLDQLVHPEDMPKLMPIIEKARSVPNFSSESDFRIVRKDGKTRWISGFIQNICDHSGKPVMGHGIMYDITERKRYEETLEQANAKLKLIGDLTRHDMTNYLAVLAGWLEIAADDADAPKTRAQLSNARNALKDVQRMIEFAADYQQTGLAAPGWMRAESALMEGLSSLSLKGVRVTSTLGDLEVYGDSMLPKVFHNLAENALIHGEHVTRIDVRYRVADDDAVIFFEDDGVGIPEEDKGRIFERCVGKHTGYGLHLCKGILAITGIEMAETGKVGEGARFEIRLPKGTFRVAGSK